MEKASNGQFREFIGKLLVKGSDDRVATIDKTKIQNAINSLSSKEDTVIDNLVCFINNDCKLNTPLSNVFTVGDIFRHRAEKGDYRLYFSDNTKNWAIEPNRKKVIPIRTDHGKLSEYALPHNMNDSLIEANVDNLGCMELEVFFCVMYLLIFKPELSNQALWYGLRKDKWYLFHVMVDGKMVAFRVHWKGGEWRFCAVNFDSGRGWNTGYLFLSFGTV